MNEKWRQQISQPKYGIIEERDVMVPMSDGIKLAVNVFRPDSGEKFPALLAMSGYGKDEQDMPIPPQPLKRSPIWDGNIEAGDKEEIVPRGYVQVIGDVRGIGKSEGEYIGGTPMAEARDSAEIVEWIAAQPWCDGNVGMVGYSYYGMMQLKTAAFQPPHLKAIFPSHLAECQYRHMAYHGGIVTLFLYGLWDGRHGTSGIAPSNAVSEMQQKLSPEEFQRRIDELLQHPDVQHYPNVYHLLHYPQKNPWFIDILLNPFDGPYWQERSIYPYYDKVKVPTKIIGKCAHDAGSFWDIYANIDCPKQLLVKPSGPEERPWREDIDDMIRWYDHWLKGNDTGVMDEPPIKMFIMGINQYRYFDEWPVPGVEFTNCYLRRWEGLSFSPELHQQEPDGFLQMPLHLSTRRASLEYVSPPLSEDLTCIGPSALHLFASIDQEDTNWIIKLIDVTPTGGEIPLGKSFLKASHRKVDPAKSSPGKPHHPHLEAEPVVPGEIYEYQIHLGILSIVFRAGHRIKLVIESMESPRDPDCQIHYHPHLNNSRTTVHKIYRNKEYRSHIVLPVIPGEKGISELLYDDNML